MFIWLRFHDVNEMISEIMTLITARQDIRYATQVYALSGPPWSIFDSTHRCTITTIPPAINSMFKFQCQEKPEKSVYFSFIHFHMTKLKDQDDSKLQFQKVGVPLLKFYNRQLD